MDILEILLGVGIGAVAAFATSFGAEVIRVITHPAQRRELMSRMKAGEGVLTAIDSYLTRSPTDYKSKAA